MRSQTVDAFRMEFSNPGFLPSFLIAACIGVASKYTTELVGRITLAECVFLLVAPFSVLLLRRDRIPVSCLAGVRKTVWIVVVWAVFQTLIDVGLRTDRNAVLRGLGTQVFWVVGLIAYATLFTKIRGGITSLLLGASVGGFLFGRTEDLRGQLYLDEYWDLAIGTWSAPALLAITLILWKVSFRLCWPFIASYSAAAFYLGGRSHGMVTAGALVAVFAMLAIRSSSQKFDRAQIRKLFFAICAGGIILYPVYIESARAGWITEKAKRQTNAVANPYNPLEVLSVGRFGLNIGLDIFMENPVTGIGRSGSDTQFYRTSRGVYRDHIHSALFEAAASGGVVCFALLCGLIYLTIQYFPVLRDERQWAVAFVGAFCVFEILWSIVMSPLVSMRFICPFFFTIQLWCYHQLSAGGVDSSPRRMLKQVRYE